MSSDITPAEHSVAAIVSKIHGIAASHTPVEIKIGVVTAPPLDLKIQVDGMVLTRKNLFINDFLLKKYQRLAIGKIENKNEQGKAKYSSAKGDIRTNSQPKRGGAGKPSFVSHSHKINNSYKASLEGDYEGESRADYKESFITADWGLKIGDKVMLAPILNGQKFVVMCKVYEMADLREADFTDGQ